MTSPDKEKEAKTKKNSEKTSNCYFCVNVFSNHYIRRLKRMKMFSVCDL